MTPLASLLVTDQALMNMARKWNLVDAAGNVWCLLGCREPATAPTLECVTCRERRRSAERYGRRRGGRRVG